MLGNFGQQQYVYPSYNFYNTKFLNFGLKKWNFEFDETMIFNVKMDSTLLNTPTANGWRKVNLW